MKKLQVYRGSFRLLISVLFLLSARYAYGQQTGSAKQQIPDNLLKIFTNSCTPCHSSKGSLMPRTKLNFDEWSEYTIEKQKSRSKEIYSMLSKDKMPPKSARENRPDIVLAKDQIDLIKKWSESLNLAK